MKRILSLIFVVLTMSIVIFADEMPKKINFPSDKFSLSTNNEMLYDGKLYTGKVSFDENREYNFKDGHLEGLQFIKTELADVSSNILNGKLDGEYKSSFQIDNYKFSLKITFANGIILEYMEENPSKIENLIFNYDGTGNGMIEYENEKIIINNGVGTSKNYIFTYNLNKEKDGIVSCKYNKNNKSLYKCIDNSHFDRDLVEKSIFPSILKFSKLLKNLK